MNFSKIDLKKWKRGELFKFYVDDMRVVMSLTVDIDVSPLIEYARKNELKFYSAMLWVVSKVINSHNEFKYAWNEDGDLICWDFISPSYTVFHEEDESFSKFVTEFDDDMIEFCKRTLSDQKRYENERGILKNQPKNFYDVSCLPWVRYQHFDVHVFDDGKFLAPVVTWGKYEVKGEKTLMPLTMNIHHAVADGFHLSRFFTEVQALIDSLG